jgi:hypothetical protein
MNTEAEIQKINAAVESFIKARRDAGEPYSDVQEEKFRRIVNQAIAMAKQPYHYVNDKEYSSNNAGIFVMPGDRREGPRYTPERLGEGVARDLRKAGLGEQAANLMGDFLRDFEKGWLKNNPVAER